MATLHQLQQKFHSIIKSLEVLHVIEGIKPCARILVNEDDLEKSMNFLHENKLKTSVSDFKVLKQNAQSEFYSDKSVKIPKEDKRKCHFFVYLSHDQETAEKSKMLEEKNMHKELGLLLGYPRCCCEFFGKKFHEGNTDLVLDALENSEGYEFPFYTNIAARHFDVSLLSHFPHSFSCEPSIEIAKKNLRIININSEQLSALFTSILQSVAVYTKGEGIFLLRKCEKIGNKITYGDVMTTTKSKMYYLLSSNKELEILSKNNFIIGGENIIGEEVGVMVFR